MKDNRQKTLLLMAHRMPCFQCDRDKCVARPENNCEPFLLWAIRFSYKITCEKCDECSKKFGKPSPPCGGIYIQADDKWPRLEDFDVFLKTPAQEANND